jgi:hypothetical protein
LCSISALLRSALVVFSGLPIVMAVCGGKRMISCLVAALVSMAPLAGLLIYNGITFGAWSPIPCSSYPNFAVSLLEGSAQPGALDAPSFRAFASAVNQIKVPSPGAERSYMESLASVYTRDDWGSNAWRITATARREQHLTMPEVCAFVREYASRVPHSPELRWLFAKAGLARAFGGGRFLLMLACVAACLASLRRNRQDAIGRGGLLYLLVHTVYLASMAPIAVVEDRYVNLSLGVAASLGLLALARRQETVAAAGNVDA